MFLCSNSKRFLELIPVACNSASDVRLDYCHRWTSPEPYVQHIVQLGATLSEISALTSLHSSIEGQLDRDFSHLSSLPA
jgi:hypothetical protein